MAIVADGVRTPLCIVFVMVTGFCAWRCAASTRSAGVERASYALHGLMCASMAAMVWFPPPLAVWQVTLFALACGWFAVRATGVTLASLRMAPPGATRTAPATSGHEGRGGRHLRCLHHAAVMTLMAWMVGATAPGTVGMPGMPMPRRAPGPAVAGGVYCAAAAVLLVAAAGWGGARRRVADPCAWRAVRDDAVHGLMTAGMAAMLFTMA